MLSLTDGLLLTDDLGSGFLFSCQEGADWHTHGKNH